MTAFWLIVFAYLKDSLPGDNFSWTDLAFLQQWHLCKQCRNRLRALVESRSPGIKTTCKHANLQLNTKRRKALGAFLLTLSDQQLVVGPAMMVAALAQRCQISCYEFQVVKSLAMLASVAHLSTLIVLRDYLVANKVVRNIRVVGMLINLCLLVFTMLTAAVSQYADKSAKIQCIMNDFSIVASDLSYFGIAIFFVLVVLMQYYSTIRDLYPHDSNKHRLRRYCCDQKKGHRLTQSEFEKWYDVNVNESEHNPESDAWREALWHRAVKRKGSRFHKWFIIVAVFGDYLGSFLINLENLLWNSSYGIASVIESRNHPPSIEGSTDTMEFGQIVPLFLLLIPVLAGN